MKKIFITIITIISVITLTSCNNNSKQQHLIHMQDSIQVLIDSELLTKDAYVKAKKELLQTNVETLSSEDIDEFIREIEALKYLINECDSKIDEYNKQLFQIELQLNNKQFLNKRSSFIFYL